MKLPLPTVSSQHQKLYGILTGKQSGKDFYNASGTLLDNATALLRVNSDRKYLIVVSIDGELYQAGSVPSCHPFIAELELTVFGESPQEIEQKAARKKWASLPVGEPERNMYESWGCTVSESGSGKYAKTQPNAPDIPIV